VPTAEAKKTGVTSEVTFSLFDLHGGLEPLNVRQGGVIDANNCRPEKIIEGLEEELLADGEQRSKCWTLGALNDALNRMRACCALMSASLFTALASSSRRFDQAESKAAPGKSGAPRSSALTAET